MTDMQFIRNACAIVATFCGASTALATHSAWESMICAAGGAMVMALFIMLSPLVVDLFVSCIIGPRDKP